MHLRNAIFLLIASLFLAGCNRSYVSVRQEWIDSRHLASTHVGTPDPRQAHPPLGQRLILNWWAPRHVLEKNPRLVLHVIFWNYTQKTITYPLESHAGYKIYSVLNEEYEKTQGLLTYRAEIVTEGDQVFAEWKHQLWVKLIDIQGESLKREEPHPLTPAPLPKRDFGITDDDENFFSLKEKPEEIQSEDGEPQSEEKR